MFVPKYRKYFAAANPLRDIHALIASSAINISFAFNPIPLHRAAAGFVAAEAVGAKDRLTIDLKVLPVIADPSRIEITAVALRVETIQIVHHDEENAVIRLRVPLKAQIKVSHEASLISN